VELQVEEYAIATPGELFDEPWTLAGEETASNLEAADGAAESIRQRPGLGAGVDVQRD
jgi:hypothetical protein